MLVTGDAPRRRLSKGRAARLAIAAEWRTWSLEEPPRHSNPSEKAGMSRGERGREGDKEAEELGKVHLWIRGAVVGVDGHGGARTVEIGEEWGRVDSAQERLLSRNTDGASFLFLHFSKKNLQKYILVFKIYSSIPLPSGRGRQGAYRPAGRW